MTDNLFNTAIVFTDIHFGKNQSSQQHLNDCANFINWVISKKAEYNADTLIFLGDWHDNRINLNVQTLNYSQSAMDALNEAFDNVYIIPGNHDLYFRERRDVTGIGYAKTLNKTTLITEPFTKGNVTLLPWLIGDEHQNVKLLNSRYVFGHLEFPGFRMNGGHESPDRGQIQQDSFPSAEYVFSGHYHPRQKKGNIYYIGNVFPFDFGDSWDDDRGIMVLNWGEEPQFEAWDEAPSYRRATISEAFSKPNSIFTSRANVQLGLDVPLNQEECEALKEIFRINYNTRKIEIVPIVSTVSYTEDDVDIVNSQLSVDDMVQKTLKELPEDGSLDVDFLIDIYKSLIVNDEYKSSDSTPIQFKNIIIRNFQSVGKVDQVINLDTWQMTLVMGENLDSTQEGSRNGVGKTLINQAITYALFGQTLSGTRSSPERMVNHFNGKDMLVRINFVKGDSSYTIERGRKPNILKLYKNEIHLELTNDALASESATQIEIEKIIGLDLELFRLIVILSANTDSFLRMKLADQRNIIESIMGVSILTKKAEQLSKEISRIKTSLSEETLKLQMIKDSNMRMNTMRVDLELKSTAWDNSFNNKKIVFKSLLDKLSLVDIENELELHELNDIINSSARELKTLRKIDYELSTRLNKINNQITNITNQIEQTENVGTCPTCKQSLEPHNHDEILSTLIDQLEQLIIDQEKINTEITENNDKIEEYAEFESIEVQKTHYQSVDKAKLHQFEIQKATEQYEQHLSLTNPYKDQLDGLKINIQPIDTSLLDDLNFIWKHQDALLKMLTQRDSFLRKRIIDQNLSFINYQMTKYLNGMELPHQVLFSSDLTLDIRHHSKDISYDDNLSTGQKRRVDLALVWAFRDLWEIRNHAFNLFFVDELIDSGLDPAGVIVIVEQLRSFARERNKNIFVISHRDDLISRMNNTIYAVYEKSFTTYRTN